MWFTTSQTLLKPCAGFLAACSEVSPSTDTTTGVNQPTSGSVSVPINASDRCAASDMFAPFFDHLNIVDVPEDVVRLHFQDIPDRNPFFGTTWPPNTD